MVSTPVNRRRTLCFVLMLLTTVTGLVWRMAPLGLPWFWFKYGGSVLWAIAVYWLVALLLAQKRPLTLALVATGVSLAVEFSRLIPSVALQAFRVTLAGRLILGSVFSLRNIVAYWLGIATVALVDSFAQRRTKLP